MVSVTVGVRSVLNIPAVCIDGGEDESNAPDIVGKVPVKDEVRAQRVRSFTTEVNQV